ncbi:MAG: transporter substrate-binding domain-containing protein [Burkholderiales bacterium]|nr:transporter substrate-binding domain-containing protein [Burkholderiales bacterium]
MTPRRRTVAWLAGAAGVVGLAGTAGWLARRRDDGSLERVRRAGLLRVGYAVEAPYAMLGPGGEVTGESPATAREVAQRLGLPRIEWVQVAFGELIPSLLERRFDLIAAGLFVTPERARRVRFSDPTVRVLPGLLVRRGNPAGVKGYRELAARTDVRVAVLAGSVEQQRLRTLGLPATQTVVVPDAQAGHAALAAAAVEVLALSLPTVRSIAAASPERFQALDDAPPPGGSAAHDADVVAFAFHPDDAALQRAWNAAQSGWVGGAEHLRTVARFGFGPAELASAPHAGEPPRP